MSVVLGCISIPILGLHGFLPYCARARWSKRGWPDGTGMANLVEITPLVRRVRRDDRGRARLVFTLTNVRDRPVDFDIVSEVAPPLDPRVFRPADG